MRKILMIIGIIAILSFAGCGSTKAGKATGTTATTAAGVISASGDATTTTMQAAVAATLSNEGWCQTGSKMHLQDTGTDLLVIELLNKGKYAGYCHAVYSLSSGGISSTVHYFLKEDGSGYQRIELNGQIYDLPLKK